MLTYEDEHHRLLRIRIHIPSKPANLEYQGQEIGSEAVFDAFQSGLHKAQLIIPAKELGLPARFEETLTINEAVFRLPDYLVRALLSAFEEPSESETLFLEIARPAGLLPLVPWERLLLPIMGSPIIRLSDCLAPFGAPSGAPTRPEVALCFSQPTANRDALGSARATETFKRLIESNPLTVSRRCTFHVFGDTRARELFGELRDEYRDDFEIVVYEPPISGAENDESSPPLGSVRDANVWLTWMSRSLTPLRAQGRRIDAIHVLADGYRGRNLGALALAASPFTDRAGPDFSLVGATQLTRLSLELGSWSIGFSYSADAGDPAGLRLLQHQLSQSHPGPIILCDLSGEPGCLRQLYEFLYPSEEAQPTQPACSSISLYCHPQWMPKFRRRLGSDLSFAAITKSLTPKIIESVLVELGDSLTSEMKSVLGRLAVSPESDISTQTQADEIKQAILLGARAAIQVGTATASDLVTAALRNIVSTATSKTKLPDETP